MTHFLAKLDHQLSAARSVQRPVQPVRRAVAQLARRRRLERANARQSSLDNIDQSMAFSNTLTLSYRTVNETRVQFAYGDLKASPSDPIGPAVSIAGVASFGTLSGSPQGRVNRMYQARQQPFAPCGGARAARRCRCHLQRRHDCVSAIGSRRVRVFVAREFPCRHIQRVRFHPDVRRDRRRADQSRTSGFTCRTSGRRIRR